MAKQLWNMDFSDPLGMKKRKEEEEKKKREQAKKTQLAYSHNVPENGNKVPAVNLSREAPNISPSVSLQLTPPSSEGGSRQRGNRGTRSEKQQEEYKRQAEENSYNIRRETALKNDRYFKELADGSNISSDRRAFLENELDLYAKDDKDWYWGRNLREAQKKEQDEFNRLSELVKTPEWDMMTPEQQEAERAKLEAAREGVAKHKSAEDTRRLEAYWEENKDGYLAKVKEGDVLSDLKYSVPYGGKYEALSDEEKAKLLCINDFYSMPENSKLENGGFLRSGYRTEKYMEEKADERTEQKNKEEEARVQSALNNPAEYIEKGRSAEYNPRNIEGNFKQTLRYAWDSGVVTGYKTYTDEELNYIDWVCGVYDEETAVGIIKKFDHDRQMEKMGKAAEQSKIIKNAAAPLSNVVNNVIAPIVYGAETMWQEYKNHESGFNDVVPEYSLGSRLYDEKNKAAQNFVKGDKGAVKDFKEFGLGLVNTAAPMLAGPYAPAVYTAQSAGGGMYETRQKGGSNRQSLAMGTLNGITTYVVSKLGVDNLLNGLKGKTNIAKLMNKKEFVKGISEFIGKQYVSEYTEGYVEAAAGNLFDWIVNRDNSDIALEIDALMKHKGYTADEAASMVLFNKLVTEPNKQGQLEGIMGIIMGGIGAGVDVGLKVSDAYSGFKKSPGSVSADVGGVNIREGMTADEVLEQLRSLPQSPAVTAPSSEGADMQYKIVTLPNGMKYVQADRQVITGDTPKEQAKNLEDYINNEIRHGRDVVIPTDEGDYLKITEDTAWKIGDPKDITQVKSNIGTHIDEVAEVSKLSQKSGLNKNRDNKRFKADAFEYRNAFFKDYDGEYYQVRVTVGVDANGKTVYNIAPPIKRQFPNVPALPRTEALQNGELSYTNNTTGAEESQGEFAYKDADVPNTPFADALGNIDINSIYGDGENDAGNEWQAARQPLSQPSADSSPYTGEPMELKGRREFDSDEAYAHYLIDVGQKELAKVPKITRAFLAAIAKRTGLKIVIGDTGAITGQKSAGGYSRSRDVLVLDYDTVQSPEKLARAVINHELVHATETSMFYKSLEKHAFEQMFGGDEKALNDAIKKKQERYARSGVKLGRDGAKAELVARYIGESVLTSEAAINRLVIEKPTLAMQIKNALVKTYDKAKMYFTDKEAYEAKYVMSDLEKGIKLFEKALDTRRNFKDFAQRLSGNTGGDVQRMFAGKTAKGANHSELARAMQFDKEGVETEKIWRETGWKKGIDGKWRFEIDDSKADFKREGHFTNQDVIRYKELGKKFVDGSIMETEWGELQTLERNLKRVRKTPEYLSDYLQHNELYENYPQLRDVKVDFVDMEPGLKGEAVSKNYIRLNKKLSDTEAKSALLHEVQHIVQGIEGFERGASIETALEYVREKARDELEAKDDKKYLDAKKNNREDEYIDNYLITAYNKVYEGINSIDDVAIAAYGAFYGEKEARNVQKRMDMSTKMRKNNFPSNFENEITHIWGDYSNGHQRIDSALHSGGFEREIDSGGRAGTGEIEGKTEESKKREITTAGRAGNSLTDDFQFSSPVAAETQQEGTDVAHAGMKMDTDGEYYKDVAYEDVNEKEFSKGFNRPWAKLKKRVYENGRESLVFDFNRSVKGSFSDSDEYKALINNADKYEDVTGFLLTPERALEKTFGKDYELWLKTGEKAVEDAKMQYQYILSYLAADLKKNIIDKYGFKAKSLESDLIQAYGEGVKSEAEIKRELNKKYKNKEKTDKVFEQIKDAEKWFRKTYDTLRHSINDTKQEIYPEVENIISKYEERLNEIDEQLILLKSGSSSALFKAESARNRTERIKQSKENAIRYIDGTIKELGIKLRKVNDSIDSKKRTDTKAYTNLLIRADNIRGSIERMRKLKEDYVAKSDEEYEKSVKRYETMQEKAELSTEKRIAQLEKRRGEIEEKLASEELWRNKRIPERKNYFRHHKSQMEKWNISNLFKGKANMTSQSTGTGSGTGKYSKSKYSWQSFAQRRRGDTPYISDAIGGFLEYLPNAVYAMTLDPVGEMYRSVANDMRNNEGTGAELPKTSALLDGLANEYLGKERSGLDDWAKGQFGNSYKRFNKAIGFVKKGHLLFSVRTAMVQASNLGNGFAYVKPQHMLTSMLYHKKKYGRADSAFMSERYSDVLTQFDKAYNKPKKFADWMMNVLDKKVAEIIWDAAYSQAISENRDNPVQWADILTRKSIGGRGIGERSGFQTSKVLTSVMSPYSLETFNDVQVLTDVFKDAHRKGKFGPKVRSVIAKLISMYLTTALIDFVVDKISGSNTGKFNPFGTLFEDILNPDEEKTAKENMLEAGASLLGNFVGSLPMGYELASLYPEQGIKYGLDSNKKVLSRKDVFGSEDPTEFSRAPFGLVGSLMNNPLNMIPGYNQAQKTYNGIKTVYEGGSYKKTLSEDDEGNAVEEKQLQYPVFTESKKELILKAAQAGLFGKSALPEAQRWVDNGFDTLNADDTARYDKIKGTGSNRELYETLIELGHIKPVKNNAGETIFTKNQVRHNAIKSSKIDEGHKAWLEITYWDEDKQKKAQAASDVGISNDVYVDMNHMMSLENKKYYENYLTQRQKKMFKATPKKEGFDDYRRYILMNDKTLSAEQKRYLDNDFLMKEGNVTQYDYTSMNAFILSGMTEAQNQKYAVTKARLGISPELYKYYLSVAGDGKDEEKKARLRANGMNAAAADVFYDSAIKNAKAGGVHDQTAYNNMTDKQKRAFGSLKSRSEFKDMEASDFAYYISCVQNLKSDSDKIARLKKCGLGDGKISAAQAKEIVRMLK